MTEQLTPPPCPNCGMPIVMGVVHEATGLLDCDLDDAAHWRWEPGMPKPWLPR